MTLNQIVSYNLEKKKENLSKNLFNSTPPILPNIASMDHYIVYLYRPFTFNFWVSIFFPYNITSGNLVQTSFTFRGHFRLCFDKFSFVFGLNLDVKMRFEIDDFWQSQDL